MGVKEGLSCDAAILRAAGGFQHFCPWIPEQPHFAEKSQNTLTRLCVWEWPCFLEKPISCSVPSRQEVRPARSKLDELLGRGSITKILERPGAGEHREFKLDKKYQKQPGECSQRCWEGDGVGSRERDGYLSALTGEIPFLQW